MITLSCSILYTIIFKHTGVQNFTILYSSNINAKTFIYITKTTNFIIINKPSRFIINNNNNYL